MKARDANWFNQIEDLRNEAWRIGKDQPKSAGRMYEVNINADPDHFLDWDKPLSQQSERVRGAVTNVLPQEVLEGASASKHQHRIDVIQSGLNQGIDPQGYKPLTQQRRAELKNELTRLKQDGPAVDPADYKLLGNQALRDIGVLNSPEVASKLRDQGIPGIRYLDQGSRTAGEGSRNYVVFDDKIVDIVRKYGIAAAVSTYGADAVQKAMSGVGMDDPQARARGGRISRALNVARNLKAQAQ
jgi:hypothetical protein